VLLEKLKAVFLSDLEAAEWMDAATREEALAKAREMRMNLGGPRSYKMFKYRVSAGAAHCACCASTKVQLLTEAARS
jgi:predicted metalloendopeptidase